MHSGVVREGQDVVFMGFPIGTVLGLSIVTHRGIISAITPVALPSASVTAQRKSDQAPEEWNLRRLHQLDGTAYPGNSGGPLLDAESGEVIGVINMVFIKGTKEAALSHPSGISFAIPVFLRELLQSAQLDHPLVVYSDANKCRYLLHWQTCFE